MRYPWIAAVAALLPLTVAAATVEPFLDVVGHPHEAQVEFLHTRGIIEGYGYGLFRPDILINRAEFLKILMLAVDGEDVLADAGEHRCFADFLGEEQWFWVYACRAKERGIIDGYPDGTFRGTKNIILAEALKIVIEAWDIPKPTYVKEPDHWYDPYMDTAASRGIFQEFPFDPAHLLTRSEMAALIVGMGENIATVGSPQPISTQPAECGNGILEQGEECDDGNLLDSDGCSKICVIVPEPIRHAAIRLEQRPMSTLEQSQGSKDIELFAFDAVAGRQDALLTGLKLRSSTGNLDKAQNYRLRIDVDGDGVYETTAGTAVPQSGILAFGDIAIPLKEGITRRVKLLADLQEASAASTIAVGFAINDSAYVEAVGWEDGRELTGIVTDSGTCSLSLCWITVITADALQVDVLERGNLYITQDSVPVRSRQVRAGELSNVLLRARLRAQAEDIEITDIAIEGPVNVIDYLELYQGSSQQSFATARQVSCDSAVSGRYCARTELVIPQDAEVTVLVRAFVRPDSPAQISGESFALSLTGDTTLPAIEAFGKGSVRTLEQNDSDYVAEGEIFIGTTTPGANSAIAGPTHDVVASNIIAIANANDDADGSPVPAGTATIAAFSFSAASKTSAQEYPVHLRDLTFVLTAQNVEIDPALMALYNPANPSATKSCSASASTGLITVTCSNLESSVLGTTILQGEALTLALRATIVNPQVNGQTSTLQVALQSLGDRTVTGTVEWDDGTTTFQWVDISQTRVRSTSYRS